MRILNKQRGEGEVAWMIGGVCMAAWITHIIVCLQAGKWGFLIAGALFFPIAIVHGLGVWIGAW